MKKKLILMFSLMALAICMFAISVSASSYFDFGDMVFEESFNGSSWYSHLCKDTEDNSLTSADEDVFGIIQLSLESGNLFGFINIERWHELFVQYNITDANSLYTWIGTARYELNLITNDGLYLVFDENASAQLYALYEKYVTELNTPTYEEGLIEGKVEGIEYFKTSSEYESALNTQYNLGSTEGIAAYLKSDDYNEALSAEYDEGYNQGVSDTESTSSSSGTGALFSVLAIVLVVLAGFYIYKSISRRRGR